MWLACNGNGIGNDTTGHHDMDNHDDHTPALSADEIADRTIEFMESIGPALLPWQATTLRAMLSYPVATRFIAPVTYHVQNVQQGIRDDLERFGSRTGFVRVNEDGHVVPLDVCDDDDYLGHGGN